LLYIIIIKRLLALKKLLLDIKKLANEDFDISFDIKGKDEIATLSKEFPKSTKKLKELKLSRDIFTKNIMHELKTPITKGKLLLDMPKNRKNQELLEKVFYRLQNLLDEFSQVERFLSANKNLHIKPYRTDDLIDSALDISFWEETNLEKRYKNITLKADFKLLTVAFKNLIDNAIKYSQDSKVIIESDENRLIFKNIGDRLKYNFNTYLEPSFNQSKQRVSLGIYIANYILKMHNFKLDYEYKNGYNIFSIIF